MIRRLMNPDFLAVDQGHSLQQVSRLLTSRARQRIEEDFVITRDGRYQGIGRAIDVFKLITEQKIQQYLTRLLQTPCESLVCYVDIDYFKPYNKLSGVIYLLLLCGYATAVVICTD